MTIESDKKALDEQVAELNKHFAELLAGKKVAAARSRKAAGEIAKLCKELRKGITARKESM